MSVRRALITITTLLTFLAACSESSLLLGGLDEQADVSIALRAPDALVQAGDEISISIERNTSYRAVDGRPDSVVIELLDYDGVVLATQRYNSVEDASTLPAVAVPELEPDLYRLTARYFNGEDEIALEEIPLFLVQDPYHIRGLSSFPASSYPEADSLLSLSLDVPMGSDPYLVWYVNGEQAASGYLSETGTTLAIAAPQLEGVFPVRVDLYPSWHSAADPDELRAPVRFTSEIFVSQDPTVLPSDLGPDEHYFMLYHMRGTTRDSGRRTELFPQTDFDASRFGRVELAARDSFFGYELDGRSGIAIPGYLWPVHEEAFSPISMAFRLLPSDWSGDRTLLESELDGLPPIGVIVSQDGRVGVRLSDDGPVFWSDLPAVFSGVIVDLTISLVPDGEEMVVLIYVDGLLISTARAPFSAVPLRSAAVTSSQDDAWAMMRGETRLGASADGFIGIIDEFGVFFVNERGEPAADESLFLESVSDRYGSSLILAEDFVNDSWDAVIGSSGSVVTGDAELEIGGDGTLTLPEFDLRRGPVELDLQISGESLWLGVTVNGEQPDDTYSIPAGESAVLLRLLDGAIEIRIGEGDVQTLTVSGTGERVGIILRGDGNDETVSVLETVVMRYLSESESAANSNDSP